MVFIYYWHKDNTKNISKKLYDVIYTNTKILNHKIFK